MNNKILTAIDLDNNQKNINNIIEEKVIQFTKKEIRKQLKAVKEARKAELDEISQNFLEDFKLSKEEIESITLSIINSDRTRQFREEQYINIKSEKDNYLEFRNIIDELNDIDNFSVDIERVGLQTVSGFKKYEDLILLSIQNNGLFQRIKESKKKIIQEYIDSKKSIEPNFVLDEDSIMMESLDNIILLREMYSVDIYVDDFVLYEKYNLQSNIDISNKLSELIFFKLANSKDSNKNKNLLNEFLPKSNTLKELTSNKYNKQLSVNDSLKNINNLVYQQIISNKMLGILFSNKFISNNKVTTLETTYTNNINREMVYRTRTLGELLFEITNDDAMSKTKEERQQIYMTYDGIRPSKEEYYKWNGLQVYDLDLKFWILKSNGDIQKLKELLHNYLIDFHWYLWICTSASGKGLHIYTKVMPPHHVYTKASDNEYISQYFHQVNYVTKLSTIYDILYRLHVTNGNGITFGQYHYQKTNGENKIILTEENNLRENKYVDNVVSRITAGIRLAYDVNPLINHNFIDLHVGLALGQTIDGYEYQETIEKVLLRDCQQIKLINENLVVDSIEEFQKNKEASYSVDLSKFVTLGLDISEIKVLPKNNINYMTRYNVCNSLAALFGKDGINIAHTLLDSKSCNNVGEINSFYSCAISNGKEPTKLGLEILRKAGIIKNIEPELTEIVETGYKNDLKLQIEQALINPLSNIDYKLLSNQYLSDLETELVEKITGEKINIVFSPAGSGKCLGKDTPIMMYNGSIKKVQDIVKGDILMGWDSTPRNVLSICSGQEELFKIIPDKGEPWVCNKSHILSLTNKLKPFSNKNIKNFTVIEYLEYLKTLKNPKSNHFRLFKRPIFYNNLSESDKLNNNDIEPYYLGLWLGDGTSTEVEITIENKEEHIINYLHYYAEKLDNKLSIYDNELNTKRYRFINKYPSKSKTKIKQYLVDNNLILNKHIPKKYLLSSFENRLKLFAGLIDSDGCSTNGSYTYTTKFDRLKDDILLLANSLGYYVTTSKIIDNRWNSGVKEYWRLIISGKFDIVPVLTPRKKIKAGKQKHIMKFKIEPLSIGDYYGFEIDGDKMFCLGDGIVTHNTELIKSLARKKRILLVLPYISVITNKIENDPSITALFDTFYGSTDIKDLAYGRNAVTTFDKFSRMNYDKISKMFDYIVLDESHLLFTSAYRIEATSNVIKKIKELFYISSNDPFASKIVLMTGTSTGEEHFFNKVSNVIRVSKPQLSKEMEFLICGDTLDSITRLASKGAQLINDGYKLMIPTNKGEIYSEKIIGMIEYLLQRNIKYGYYKRSNTEQEICQLINNENSTGDYDIVFCSNYLSVGVDINDKIYTTGNKEGQIIKFASLYYGNFSGYEIEQFNARIRKTGIKSIYCVTTNKADGTTLDSLLNEPDLLLKITDEDQLYFIDDKSISSAKTEFIASYDPVLHKIITPGFSLLNGKIQFNLEEYELVSFENKYSICMEHPIKVARELAKYGYKITVSTEFEGLSTGEQEVLKKMGIEAAKNEKIRKHNLLVGTYIDLINGNSYSNEHGLEFTDAIDWISKNQNKIIEDRDLTIDVMLDDGKIETQPCFVKIIYDVFATPQQVIVKSREALEKMIRPAKYIIKRYSKQKALDIIFGYVDTNGILKQKNFQRAINLLKLIDSSEANELAEPITKALEKMYLFIDSFEINKDYRIGYETYQSLLETWTNEYIDTLGIRINTKYGFDKIRDGLVEMLADLSTKSQSKNGIRFTYNLMPEQDSTNILNRRSIDNLVASMFNITENVISNKNKPKQKHIVLQSQTF